MKLNRSASVTAVLVGCVCLATPAAAAELVTLNTPRTFPEITDVITWENRAKEIRAQALISSGLWPMPDKTPLNAQIFGRIERPDYSIEKVRIETLPGVFLAGNLFRPLPAGRGPHPAILNPHGHWAEGRLVDSETGSVAARCIKFARMGMVAFAYDMVGYNDTTQFSPRDAEGRLASNRYYDGHVQFAQDLTNQIWGISLMGLQTWNSIRALDFLEELPDVDPRRIACTGASGGGTQTFMLGAVDNRPAALAPIVMVSHSMQGGCWCENAPGLRVRHSNMEYAAVAAPRPQQLVGATGDWTKTTMEIEGPAIADVYRLYGPATQFRYSRFDFDHNYNQTTREAVYAFMAEHLLNRTRVESLPELDYRKEPASALRLGKDSDVPPGARSAKEVKAYLIGQAREKLAAFWPKSREELTEFREQFSPIYRQVFQLESDPQRFKVQVGRSGEHAQRGRVNDFVLSGPSTTHTIAVRIFEPRRRQGKKVVVLAHPLGMNAWQDQSGMPTGLASQLLDAGFSVIVYDGFLTGSRDDAEERAKRDPSRDFFTTYNRTDLQEHVGDLVVLGAFARSHLQDHQVIFSGHGKAGLWAVMAAPAADAVTGDTVEFATEDDHLWIQREWITPSVRRIGGFDGPALLAAPRPLLLHHTGGSFSTATIADVYKRLKAASALRTHNEPLDEAALLAWIRNL
ncbi:MAG TPA: hypothetical protein DCY13_11100 [Verrucomicrobiales bacterium]|nr:hypothetical protein [Verrucomicrobiales bacterium]